MSSMTRWPVILSVAILSCLEGGPTQEARGSGGGPLESPLQGGLCVVLGSGDVDAVAALAKGKPWVVHWLQRDSSKVEKAREVLKARGLYGQVSVETWDKPFLPYADCLVTFLWILEAEGIAEAELVRAVRPHGALVYEGGPNRRTVIKPRPEGMDEWTHWRHGADRNPVSRDTMVDVPRRIQWLSVHGEEGKDMVTAGGRAFYSIGGKLRARDAFNGTPLWTVNVDAACSPVAADDRVFVAGKGTAVCLDAATGKELRSYPGGGAPNALLYLAGTLLVVDDKAVRAFVAAEGRPLWTFPAVLPRAVSSGDGAVFLIAGEVKAEAECSVTAVELSTGKVRWQIQDCAWANFCFRSSTADGKVAFETGRYAAPKKNLLLMPKNETNGVKFLSARDGNLLREVAYRPAMRHDENARVFFLDKGVAFHRMEKDQNASTIVLYKDLAGEPETFPALPPNKQYFYCYPPTATSRFFIYGQLSFTDWTTHVHAANPITRGSCGSWSEGVLPANGMTYIFPKSCSCFSMLSGTGALAPAASRPLEESSEIERGPAAGASIVGSGKPGDWPCHRGDEYRSGSTPDTVLPEVGKLWAAEIAPTLLDGLLADEWKSNPYASGPLTAPVIAEGLVVVAQPHAHRVVALNAADGRLRWEFTANGRVDTPPTVFDGLCLFGTRSGWVYCLRASDGGLVWRRRLAPADRRIMHFGQVESPWPAPGSVLVTGGTAFVGVGIHPLADGGIRVHALDPRTGAVKWSRTVSDMEYDKKGWHGRLGLEQDFFDLMVKDGDKVALSRWVFEPDSGKSEFLWHNAYYRNGKDGAYMQRGTWSYGYPMNRPRMKRPLLVCRGASILGANRVKAEGGELKLFRRDFKPGESFDVQWDEQPNDTASRIGIYFPANRLAEKATWSAPYPGWIEAMVWAGSNVFLYAKDKLRVYSAGDGKLLREADLERPVWDGIAAAHGRLFISTASGKVVCLGSK